MDDALGNYLQEKQQEVETYLSSLINPEGMLGDHFSSLRYSLLAGGKRVRPILAIAAAEALGCDYNRYMPIICSLECIHTYSLIHDDLPAMDDDDLRRGKPTNHKIFGEAEAILAGDGLLTLAFSLLSEPDLNHNLDPATQLKIMHTIAQASGSWGMVGGQSLDVASEGKDVSLETLQYIHRCKTGALITASVQTGAFLGQADKKQFEAFTSYGRHIGLAFQMKDDLLNIEGTTEELGKAAGSDAQRQKVTYPALLGLAKTKEQLQRTIDQAITGLNIFDQKAEPLRLLANYILARRK